MKVAHAQDNVKNSQGLGDTAQFKIAANAHAFKLLSSGLYSDKIRAVLREIGCNARDAHIAAGKRELPIRVKLPNQLSDQFYIQDWGPGLSHEEVMGLYSTYFASTKQTSNDFTGAFGLGSKSPFAYTDSFTVVSSHGGKKRTYTIYLNNVGAPTTSLMTEEALEPDWESGVRVGFSVKPADFAEFTEKAKQVFQWFDPLPQVKGAAGVIPVQVKERYPDFWVMKENTGSIQVLMGAVAYPLKASALGINEHNEPTGADLLQYVGVTQGLVLPVPVGTVCPVPSREQLQYDAESIKALSDHLRRAVKSMGAEVIRVLEETEKGGWKELCDASEKIKAVLPAGLRWGFEKFGVALGLTADRARVLDKYIRRARMDIPLSTKNICGVRLATGNSGGARLWILTPATRTTRSGKTKASAKTHLGAWVSLNIDPSTAIVYGVETHAASRLKAAVKAGTYNQLICLCKDKDHPATLSDTRDEAAALSKALGDIPIIELKDLPVPASVIGKKSKYKPKNWVPTLDPQQALDVHTFQGPGSMKIKDMDHKFLMCARTSSSWGGSRDYVRDYNKSVDEDREVPVHQWDAMWLQYKALAEALKLPDTVEYFAMLPAREIKQLYLKECGFGSMHEEIGKYVRRADVLPAMRKKLAAWRPRLPDFVGYNTGWITRLATQCKQSVAVKNALLPVLDKVQLGDTVRELLAAKPTKAQRVNPEFVDAYNGLARLFAVSASLDTKDLPTLEAMDSSFAERFPLSAYADEGTFHELCTKSPTQAAQLLTFIVSEEIKT